MSRPPRRAPAGKASSTTASGSPPRARRRRRIGARRGWAHTGCRACGRHCIRQAHPPGHRRRDQNYDWRRRPVGQGYCRSQPGVIVAGLNPICTDAVMLAVMGFDPMGDRGSPPFEDCDKHPEAGRRRWNWHPRLEADRTGGRPDSQREVRFREPPRPHPRVSAADAAAAVSWRRRGIWTRGRQRRA